MTKENIKEQRVRGGGVSTAPKININIPKVGSGGSGGRNNPATKLNPGKVTPQSQIKKIDPAPFNRSASSVTSTPSGDNLKAGSFGISKAGQQQAAANRAEFKAKADAVKSSSTSSVSTETKPQSKMIRDPKTKTLRRRGSVTARRAENLEKNRLRAQAMAKARIEAKKKAGEQGNSTQSSSSSQTMSASYTPDMDAYDMVLEYLLSTEQAATIEEANYVMMQLDEENIQEIVGTALKGLKMVGKFGAKGVPQFAALAGTAAALGPSVGKLAYKATETAGNVANKIGNFNPFSGYINKKRNESPLGGNKRVDDTRKGSGDKKVGEKIYF